MRHEELERALDREPDSIEAHLVYADWLSAAGDPRGELIALQCHGAPFEAHLGEHRARILGPLAGDGFRVEWRRGFVDRLTVLPPVADPRAIAGHLLELPACLLMRKLAVRAEIPSVIAGLCEHGLPAQLRALTLGSFDPEDRFAEDSPFEAVISLMPRLDQIEALRVRGPPFWLQAIGAKRSTLRSLGIRWGALDLSFLRDLFVAPWPRLEKLVLWFGGNTAEQTYFRNHGYPWEIDPEIRLAPLFEGTGFGALEELSILETDFADRIREPLARSALGARLARLDLS